MSTEQERLLRRLVELEEAKLPKPLRKLTKGEERFLVFTLIFALSFPPLLSLVLNFFL